MDLDDLVNETHCETSASMFPPAAVLMWKEIAVEKYHVYFLGFQC